MNKRLLILSALLVITSACRTVESPNTATRADELKNLRWGMFVCWSFSTFSGKEWTPGVTDTSFFKATGCDTDQWARTAKEAGMGYILFLTKHHDGFCLWDTKTTDRKVTKSPLGRDVLAELRKSCDKHGVKLALYFSEGDWNWPGAADGKGWKAGVGKNPEMKKAQLRELLTQYGPVEYIWFDHAVGDGGLSHAETIAFCKSLQPGCFVGFNHGEQEGCDIRLGEMGRPGPLDNPAGAGPYMKDAPSKNYRLAEFTYPILPPHQGGAMWFYSLPIHDALCLPAAKLYNDYLGAVRFGNIFSLDVGPDYAGRLREVDVQTLRQVGDMIRSRAPHPDLAQSLVAPGTIAPGPFEPIEDSLRQYHCPDWFRDAKLGIWAVWGPESVPMQGDWYAHFLYVQGHPQNKFHVEHYGHPSKFGFKDIIPLWKAEKWEPEKLMALYKKAGAKYFCMIAEHHDNFDCWNSKFQRCNSVNMGPHRDIAGEWQQAATKEGLRFGMTEHLAASWWFYSAAKGADTNGPMAGVAYDGADPKFADLYWSGNEKPDGHYYLPNAPELVQRAWFDRIKDMVDRYHPDLLYSDSPLPYPDHFGRSLLAHYYNANTRQHGGRNEAVYNCKQDSQGRWVQDLERGVMDGISPYPWQTDTCVGGWYYDEKVLARHGYKTPATVIHMLCDIVSKNGNLLLNFPPRPDGTLDEDELKILDAMASWMTVNGEAIYGTRPWKVYGEGPSKAQKGGHFNEGKLKYTARDIRFTARDGALYAIALGWPKDNRLVIRSLASAAGKISGVALLGYSGKLEWQQTDDGLVVKLPAQKPCELAYSLKISAGDLQPVPVVYTSSIAPDADGRIVLTADEATTHGDTPRYENGGGKDQIGYWADAKDFVSWNIKLDKPGAFAVAITYSCAAPGSEFTVEVGKQKLTGKSASTGSWATYRTDPLGVLKLDKPGTVTLAVKPKVGPKWKVIGLKSVTLTSAASQASMPADWKRAILTGSIKAFCVDFNWGPGGPNGFAKPGLWADADPVQHVAWYERLGANVIQTFAVSCNGYAWYKGGVVPPQPGLAHDFLPEVVKLGHAKKMLVMGYFCINANTLWGQQHPDLSYGFPSAYHIPFTDAYLDYLAASIGDAVRKTGMDGFMIDWVWCPTDAVRKKEAGGKWLEAEKKLYQQLMTKAFPGEEKLTAEERLAYEHKAIDRCWARIRDAAKRANPACVIWLSCNKVTDPAIARSRMLKEVDWMMDESGTPAAMKEVAPMFGPGTRQMLCLAGWGDKHKSREILSDPAMTAYGIYGFAKPTVGSLFPPISYFLGQPIEAFKGNDRSISVLARYFNGKPFDFVAPSDSRCVTGGQ